jgi:hypothetical protein
VARDRALYYAFTMLTFALAVTRWVTSTPENGPFFRPGLWRELLHPLVTVPLALALVFAVRVVRKAGWLPGRTRPPPSAE